MNLVTELVARAAHSGAGWVATLNHELLNDAVEDHAVVKRLAGLSCAGAWVFPLD